MGWPHERKEAGMPGSPRVEAGLARSFSTSIRSTIPEERDRDGAVQHGVLVLRSANAHERVPRCVDDDRPRSSWFRSPS